MELTWKIVDCNRTLPEDYVQTAHWTVVAEDGDFSASAYGSVGFSGELTTPYADLTEAQVLEWVWGQIDKAEVESNLTAQINAQKNPVSAAGVPWGE